MSSLRHPKKVRAGLLAFAIAVAASVVASPSASAGAPTTLSLYKIAVGAELKVKAVLTNEAGSPLYGQAVSIKGRSGDRRPWHVVASGHTNHAGSFSYTAQPYWQYQAVFSGSPSHAGSSSAVLKMASTATIVVDPCYAQCTHNPIPVG